MLWMISVHVLYISAPVNGGPYQLFKTTSGEQWVPARQRCSDAGMDLVIITNITEHELVKQYIISVGGLARQTWIGMIWDKNTQKHVWVDGSPVTWTIWVDATEPDCMNTDLLSTNGCSDQNRVRMLLDYTYRTMTEFQYYDVLCEGHEPTSSPPINEKSNKGLPLEVIIGLAAGFGGFIVLCCMCCCLWKIFCADKDENKIDQDPDVEEVTHETAEQMKKDNPWMKHEEISFCLRQKYVFNLGEEITGKRHKYIK